MDLALNLGLLYFIPKWGTVYFVRTFMVLSFLLELEVFTLNSGFFVGSPFLKRGFSLNLFLFFEVFNWICFLEQGFFVESKVPTKTPF